MKRIPLLSLVVMAVVATDTFLVAPLLPDLTRRFGNSAEQAGWMVSAYAIGYCLTAVFSGPLSDRFDRKRVLVLGMAVFSVATAACGLAWTFESMLALRFLTGVAAAVGSPQIWAAIPQLVPADKVLSVMAAPTAGLTIAQLAGVPVGSFLAARSTSVPFIVVGALGVLVTIAVIVWFPSVPSRGSSGSLLGQYVELAHTPHALGRFAAYLIFQTGNFAVLSFAPTWFADDFGLTTARIGVAMIVLGAGNTVGALVGPRMVRRLDAGRTLVVATVVYACVYVALPVSPGIRQAVAGLTLTFAVGGVIFPVFQMLLQSLTTTARGTVSALTNVLMYAGSTIAGIIGGPLILATGGFAGISVLALIAVLVSGALWAASWSRSEASVS